MVGCRLCFGLGVLCGCFVWVVVGGFLFWLVVWGLVVLLMFFWCLGGLCGLGGDFFVWVFCFFVGVGFCVVFGFFCRLVFVWFFWG